LFWQEEGIDALRTAAKRRLARFIQVAASLVPQHFKFVQEHKLVGLSDASAPTARGRTGTGSDRYYDRPWSTESCGVAVSEIGLFVKTEEFPERHALRHLWSTASAYMTPPKSVVPLCCLEQSALLGGGDATAFILRECKEPHTSLPLLL